MSRERGKNIRFLRKISKISNYSFELCLTQLDDSKRNLKGSAFPPSPAPAAVVISCTNYAQAGNYVKDEVWHALLVVITNAPNVHGYTVRALYKAVQTSDEQYFPCRREQNKISSSAVALCAITTLFGWFCWWSSLHPY